MTIAEMNIACAHTHIETLRKHGAHVTGPDGQRTDLSVGFYDAALAGCREGKYNAVCYELFLPGIDEPLLIAVHADGRVDTGSEKAVLRCLDR